MERKKYIEAIKKQFRVHPVCALLGPRQVGKTTLAQMYISEHQKDETHIFDLENPLDLARLESPMLSLAKYSDSLIIIDEIQRRPELFPVIRVLVDEPGKNRRFLILGSASRDLIQQSSETLAGRIGYIEISPFSVQEIGNEAKLFLRGGFPRSYLAEKDEDSYLWRQSYISMFLERDLPSLGFQIPSEQIRRFWLMLAHSHGQIFNASKIGRSLGVSDHTARRYLDILVGTFMIRLLPAWFENLGKRQVKSPKFYFRDCGILLGLLGIQAEKQLEVQPNLGALWEGFALEETIRALNAQSEECYYWATQGGAELDLLIIRGGKRTGYEFKYTDSPRTTSSMHIAIEDLRLDHLYAIYPGKHEFPLTEKITAKGLQPNPTETTP